MSSQELSNEISYDISSNLRDNSLNLFNKNNDYEKFFKSVFLSFIGIFVWGILGTTCIFWLKHAADTIVQSNNQNCYTNKLPFNFIDLYFPYDINKLPYALPDGCDKLKGNANIPKINNATCDDPLSWIKNNGESKITLTKSINYPYNYFTDTKTMEAQLKSENISNVQKFFIFIKLLFTSSLLANITGGRELVNKFLYKTNGNNYIPSFLIMILAKVFFALILFIRFVGSLFTPLINIGTQVHESDFNKYLLIATRWWINKPWWKNNFIQNPNILMEIFLVIISLVVVPILLLVDTPFLIIFLLPILLIGMLVFLLSFIMTIITMLVQMFKLLEGTIKSGKFTQIFGCNINLLITIFGMLIIIAANKSLDSTIVNFMSISFVAYIIYQLFKFFIS